MQYKISSLSCSQSEYSWQSHRILLFLPKMSKDSLANCSALTTSNLCYKHIQRMLQWAKGEETANSSAPIFVTSLVDGSVISQYQGLINSTLTSQCRDHGLPLYCRYLYSPCTEESEEFALTREECNVLTNDICVGEFRRLKQILTIFKLEYLPLIPTCNELQVSVQLCVLLIHRTTVTKTRIPLGPQKTALYIGVLIFGGFKCTHAKIECNWRQVGPLMRKFLKTD